MSSNEKYLEALDRYLQRHLSTDLRATRIQEIRTHLAMDQEDRQTKGLDVEAAARGARRALGSPEVLARQMVRQARGYDSAPAWRLTLLCGALLAPATVAGFALQLPLYFQPEWLLRALHFLPFMVMVYFGFLVVRTQRWLAWPMVGWSAIATLCLIAMNLMRLGPAAQSAVSVRNEMLAQVRQINSDLAIADAWKVGRAPANRAPVAHPGFQIVNYYPFVPIGITRVQKSYILERVDSAESPQLWKSNGSEYVAFLQNRRENIELGLAAIDHSNPPWRRYLPRYIGRASINVLEQFAAFAIVNGILLLLTGIRHRRKSSQDPLLA